MVDYLAQLFSTMWRELGYQQVSIYNKRVAVFLTYLTKTPIVFQNLVFAKKTIDYFTTVGITKCVTTTSECVEFGQV